MTKRTVFADIERNRGQGTAMVSVWSCIISHDHKASDFKQHERYETASRGAQRSANRAKVLVSRELGL